MSNCHGAMAVATTKGYKKNHISFVRIRCKLWNCEYCAIENRRQWRAVLYRRLPEISKLWSFHTFTTGSHKKQTIEEAEKIIKTGWDKLMKRLQREYGRFSYVRTIELHKSGYPHIHALFSLHIPDIRYVATEENGYWISDAISDHVVACDFGYIQSSENLDTQSDEGKFKALGYATKYMTKREDTHHQFTIRFIQTSRDIKLKNLPASKYVWELKSGIYENEVLKAWHYDINLDKRLSTDDFDDSFIYPSELNQHD